MTETKLTWHWGKYGDYIYNEDESRYVTPEYVEALEACAEALGHMNDLDQAWFKEKAAAALAALKEARGEGADR